MQKRVERAALPSYMQEQMENLERAGYKVLETCQIDDTYTAGVERQGKAVVLSYTPAAGQRAADFRMYFDADGWSALADSLQQQVARMDRKEQMALC